MDNNTFFIEEINSLAKNDKELLISMGEEMYHSQIDFAVEDMLNKQANIILVAGPSSSGKTTTSKLIEKKLEEKGVKCLSVSLDDFFLDREKTPLLPNGNYDYENITALDLKYFNQFISELYSNGCALMPKYNFVSGRREEKYKKVKIDENTKVVIEGLHALNPNLLSTDKKLYRVYICPTSNFDSIDKTIFDYTQLRLLRRLLRDYLNRGRTVEKTLAGWQEVLDGEKLYIDPYKHLADSTIDSTHMYEPLVYANHLLPLLKNSEIEQELKQKLGVFEKLNKKFVPKNSLLNEFVK